MTYSESLRASPAHDISEPGDSTLVAAIAGGGQLQDEFYVRYRRPLMQVFLQRRIDRDAAQDLLQRTFLQDGDAVTLRGHCERAGFRRIGFGSCMATVLPAGSQAATPLTDTDDEE